MFKNKRIAIFDFDGTLVNSMDYWANLDRILLKRLTGREYTEDFQNLWETKMKGLANSANPILDYCGFLKESYNVSLSREEILDMRDAIAREFYRKDISLKNGAEAFVKKLKDMGLTLVIATTTGRDNINEAIKNERLNGIFECFSQIYTYNDVEKQKPDAEVHFKIMEKFGVKSEECIIFEDSLSGVLAAENASVEVVSIKDSQSIKNTEEIKKRSMRYIESFEELL